MDVNPPAPAATQLSDRRVGDANELCDLAIRQASVLMSQGTEGRTLVGIIRSGVPQWLQRDFGERILKRPSLEDRTAGRPARKALKIRPRRSLQRKRASGNDGLVGLLTQLIERPVENPNPRSETRKTEFEFDIESAIDRRIEKLRVVGSCNQKAAGRPAVQLKEQNVYQSLQLADI